MKNIFLLISATLSIFGCSISHASGNNTNDSLRAKSDTKTENPANLLTLSDAEKILGESAFLKDSSTSIEKDVIRFHCAYAANTIDEKTGKTGIIYFLLG